MDEITIGLPPSFTYRSIDGRYRAHQELTASKLIDHDIVINDSMTGSGKTLASLLHLKRLVGEMDAGYHVVLYVAPVNSLATQVSSDIQDFLRKEHLDSSFASFPIMKETLDDLKNELERGRMGGRFSKAELLAMFFGNPISMRREVLNVINNITHRVSDSIPSRTNLNYVIVINPDILYYILFSDYYKKQNQNIIVDMFSNVKYVIFDEFHYYSAFQLNAFIAITSFWKIIGKFDNGFRICLLSATPNDWLYGILEKTGASVAVVNDKTVPLSKRGEMEPFLSPANLHIHEKSSTTSGFNKEMVKRKDIGNVVQAYIDDGKYGVIIGNSLRHVQEIYDDYSNRIGNRYFSRITGPIERDERLVAVDYQCICCTSTVDIGFNFVRSLNKCTGRQFVDFIFVDFTNRDEFLQRVGRAGRVSFDVDSKIPSEIHIFFPPKVFNEIKDGLINLDANNMSRIEILSFIGSFIRERNYEKRFFNEFGYFVCSLLVDKMEGYMRYMDMKAIFSSWKRMLHEIYVDYERNSNRLRWLYNFLTKKLIKNVSVEEKRWFLYHYITDSYFRPVRKTFLERLSNYDVETMNDFREKMQDELKQLSDESVVDQFKNRELELSSYEEYNRCFFSSIVDNFRDGDGIDAQVRIRDRGFLSNSNECDYSMRWIMSNYDYEIEENGDETDETGVKPVVLTKKLEKFRPVILKLDLSGFTYITKDSFEGNGETNENDVLESINTMTRRYLWKFGWFEGNDLSVECEGAKIPPWFRESFKKGIVGFIAPESYLYTSRLGGFNLVVKFRDNIVEGKYALFTGKNAMQSWCNSLPERRNQ